MNNTTNHNDWLRSILWEEKLNGPNFYDWYRKLRIVLKQEGKTYVLRRPLPEKIGTNASHAVRDAWNKHYTDVVDVRSLMLASMESDKRELYETMESPIEIINDLKDNFEERTRVERYDTVKSLLRCKLHEGNPVCRHVNVIIGYIKYLEELDYPIGDKLAILIILQSLPSSFDKFVKNYVKRGLTKSVTELQGLLMKAELDMKKGTQNVLRVQKGTGFTKSIDKGGNKAIQISDRDKHEYSRKPKSGPSDRCSYCNELGHVVTKCNKFLEGLTPLVKKYVPSSQGICVAKSIFYFRH